MAAQDSSDDNKSNTHHKLTAANEVLQIFELVELILLEVIGTDYEHLSAQELTTILIKYRNINRTFNHVLKTSHYIHEFSGLNVCSFKEASNQWRCYENGYYVERYVRGYPLRLPKILKHRPESTYEGDGDDGELYLEWGISSVELKGLETDDCGSWRGFWFGSANTREVHISVWDEGKPKYRGSKQGPSVVKEKIVVDWPATLGDLVDRAEQAVGRLDSGRDWGVHFYQTVDPDGSPSDWW